MRKAASFLALLTILLISCLSSACALMPDFLPQPDEETSTRVGPAGGTVEVSDTSSPLCGVKVSVPEGALEEEVDITVEAADQYASVPELFVKVGNGIQLGPDGTEFQLPVIITIPYVDDGIDEDTTCVYEYRPVDGGWTALCVESVDADHNTISVSTDSFSQLYPLALKAGATYPASSMAGGFDPKQDGMKTTNSGGTCFGEVSFVNWFWETKSAGDGRLMSWRADNHTDIATMAHCTTLKENTEWTSRMRNGGCSRLNDRHTANLIRSALVTDNTPQMVFLCYARDSHAVLVYGYSTAKADADLNPGVTEIVTFYGYDPNPPKERTVTFDGLAFSSGGSVLGFFFVGDVPSPEKKLEFVYQYFKTPPEITETSPRGVIDDRRPTISATIHYPFIEKNLTSIELDGTRYPADRSPVVFQRIDDHNAKVSLTLDSDLSMGKHKVRVSASSVYSQGKLGNRDCASAKEEPWDFTIGGEGWDLTLQVHLPAWHMAARCIEVYHIAEDYEAAGGEGDLDLEQMGAPAWVGEAWDSISGGVVTVPITRDGSSISGSTQFIHQPTGYTITADLTGTIVGDKVTFVVNYHVPPEVQTFSMPRDYSDQMSEWTGTVYYSIPSLITVSYEGTMSADGKAIAGTFTTHIDGQCARYRFHEKEYSYGVGYGREELLFDGIVELTFSNVRFHGDFAVNVAD